MTKQELQEKVDALPEPVQDHLYDESVADLNDEIISRNDLTEEQYSTLFALLKELFVKALPLNRLGPEIKERFGFGDEKAKKLALDIAGYRLLPLNEFIGDVDGYIRDHGGDVSVYPDARVRVAKRTKEQAVADVVSSVGAGTLPHRLKSRLHDVVKSYFADVRTAEQLFEILTRSEKIGGVGLSHEAARGIVEEAKEEKRSVIIAEEAAGEPTEETQPLAEEETEKELTASKPHEDDSAGKPAPAEAGATPESEESVPADASTPEPAEVSRSGSSAGIRGPKDGKDDFATIMPEDEEEIAEVAASLPRDPVERSKETDKKIRASVDELYKASGIAPVDEEMERRLKKIIENRLRDVRDAMETLEILTQPKELGGMSLPHAQARKTVGFIEDKLKEVHARHEGQVKDEKRAWAGKRAAEEVARIRKEKEEEHRKQEEAYTAAVSGSEKARKKSAAQPQGDAMQAVKKAAPSGPAPRPQPQQRPAPAPQASPEPAQRPRVEDVKFQPKLTGPLEELQSTSLEDFRHLSKDPKEAALKIKDKIDLLGEESFSKKMQGIDAWNRSGAYRLYMEMMREALEGVPMEQVIQRRKEASEPALSKEEIGALSDLSSRLRY